MDKPPPSSYYFILGQAVAKRDVHIGALFLFFLLIGISYVVFRFYIRFYLDDPPEELVIKEPLLSKEEEVMLQIRARSIEEFLLLHGARSGFSELDRFQVTARLLREDRAQAFIISAARPDLWQIELIGSGERTAGFDGEAFFGDLPEVAGLPPGFGEHLLAVMEWSICGLIWTADSLGIEGNLKTLGPDKFDGRFVYAIENSAGAGPPTESLVDEATLRVLARRCRVASDSEGALPALIEVAYHYPIESPEIDFPLGFTTSLNAIPIYRVEFTEIVFNEADGSPENIESP